MPTSRKTTTPAAKQPAKRAPRKATAPKDSAIAAKRRQARGEDAPQESRYAPTVWGADNSLGTLTELELPSGQMVLAQRPGPEGLMAAGMLDDLDMLSTVLPKVMGGKGKQQNFDPTVIMKNPAMLQQAIKLMNRVIVHVVVEPSLEQEPDDPREKVLGKIYPSSVGMEDKTFIFNWAVGGTRDLQRFRDGYEESVANLDVSEDVEDTTE